MENNKNIPLKLPMVIFCSAATIILVALFLFSKTSVQSEGDIFAKKQECFKYENQTIDFVTAEDRLNGTQSHFWEIFYSPKANSCLYVIVTPYKDPIRATWSLNDVLTNQILVSTTTPDTSNETFKQGLDSIGATVEWFVNTVKDYGGNGNYAPS